MLRENAGDLRHLGGAQAAVGAVGQVLFGGRGRVVVENPLGEVGQRIIVKVCGSHAGCATSFLRRFDARGASLVPQVPKKR